MLDLVDSFVGGPSADVHILSHTQGDSLGAFLVFQREFIDRTLAVRSMHSPICVVLLDAETLEFCRALAFWEVFPGTRESHQHVRRISLEPGMKLVCNSTNTFNEGQRLNEPR